MRLGDAPGAQDFVKRCVAAAADLGLLFVGQSDERVMAELSLVRDNLISELTPIFGSDVTNEIAARFVVAVLAHRRELESGAVPGGALN